jgi:hypothetical protein
MAKRAARATMPKRSPIFAVRLFLVMFLFLPFRNPS